MVKAWKRNITPLLRTELEKLASGNAVQKARYQSALAAMLRVLQNPVNSNYKKSDLADHWAVNVGQQFRLFYYIEYDYHVVNFVWLNDDDHIHTTDTHTDPCYDRFKKLLRDGAIGRYIHVIPKTPHYEINGNLKSDDYIHFKCTLELGEAQSGASLSLDEGPEIEMLVKRNERVYAINFIHSNDHGIVLKIDLLRWMCEKADENSVHLSYYSSFHQGDFSEMKVNFLANGFDLIQSGKEEVYLRLSKR